jgi:hypothetical protein
VQNGATDSVPSAFESYLNHNILIKAMVRLQPAILK